MAKIHIGRSSDIFNGGTPYQIYIDDEKMGTIGNGEDKYFEVRQGEHTVTTKMNFFMGSPKVLVTVKDDEVKSLKTNGISGTIWLLVLGLACAGMIYLSDAFPLINQYAYIIYPGLFALYFLTIARTTYLNLTLEEKTRTERSDDQPAVNHPKMAKIYIDRSSEFFNKNKPCEIYIDDKKVGTVGSGEEKYFEVEQGEHSVVAKMGIGSSTIFMGGSPKVLVTVKGGDIQRLKVSGISGLLLFLGFIVISGVSIPAIEPYLDFDIKNYLLIPYAFLFILFYFTIGKRRFLSLKIEG